jgi:hypothetical protein
MPVTQSSVPSTAQSGRQLLLDQLRAQDLLVLPPQIFEANGEVFPYDPLVRLRSLQNCSTDAVKYAIMPGAGTASANVFHGVLAGGSATDDGEGGFVDLSRVRGRVTVWSSGTVRVATFVAKEIQS